MAPEPHRQEQSSPAFAVPMDPAHYTRRTVRDPHQVVEAVTPQRDLFVLAHLGIPRVDPERWRLEIGGLVERPATLSLADLRRLPPRRPDIAVRRIANVVWSGVDLADLLRRCGIRAEARFLWSYGLDRGEYDGVSARWYVKDLPLARLGQGGVLLAYAVNGEPLMPEHGSPLRLVVPGFYGTNSVKWLWRLELAEARAGGPFTTELYNDPDHLTGGTRPVWEAPPVKWSGSL
jgi:DMSO/TMAO reductase YedYZ molybdopterin-dependent catalytic subunit